MRALTFVGLAGHVLVVGFQQVHAQSKSVVAGCRADRLAHALALTFVGCAAVFNATRQVDEQIKLQYCFD